MQMDATPRSQHRMQTSTVQQLDGMMMMMINMIKFDGIWFLSKLSGWYITELIRAMGATLNLESHNGH